jgi:23S rRNA (guanosine2251-2'-O)-methyltransferase
MEQKFQIEGRNPVIEALTSGESIEKIYIQKGNVQGSAQKIINLARKKKIQVTEVDKNKLNAIAETDSHQGVVAIVSPIEYVSVEDIIKKAEEKGEQPFIVILDEIEDPHNLGSIIRSANAFGAHGVIIPKHRSASVTATAVKTSAGACFYTPVAKVTNLVNTMKELKKMGIWITGADMGGEKDIYSADFTGPIAIVIGNEGSGMTRLVREECDFIVNIPMVGEIESLNASVSASIFMYKVSEVRGKGVK